MTRSRPRPTEAVTGRASAPLSRDRSRVPSPAPSRYVGCSPVVLAGCQSRSPRPAATGIDTAEVARVAAANGTPSSIRPRERPKRAPTSNPRPTTTSAVASNAAAVTCSAVRFGHYQQGTDDQQTHADGHRAEHRPRRPWSRLHRCTAGPVRPGASDRNPAVRRGGTAAVRRGGTAAVRRVGASRCIALARPGSWAGPGGGGLVARVPAAIRW